MSKEKNTAEQVIEYKLEQGKSYVDQILELKLKPKQTQFDKFVIQTLQQKLDKLIRAKKDGTL